MGDDCRGVRRGRPVGRMPVGAAQAKLIWPGLPEVSSAGAAPPPRWQRPRLRRAWEMQGPRWRGFCITLAQPQVHPSACSAEERRGSQNSGHVPVERLADGQLRIIDIVVRQA